MTLPPGNQELNLFDIKNPFRSFNAQNLHKQVSTWGIKNRHILNFAPVFGGPVTEFCGVPEVSSIKVCAPLGSINFSL